jgi:hypothetical protein
VIKELQSENSEYEIDTEFTNQLLLISHPNNACVNSLLAFLPLLWRIINSCYIKKILSAFYVEPKYGELLYLMGRSLNCRHWIQICNLSWLFFFFCGTRAWTQGLHLEPIHQPIFLWRVFHDRVSQNYLPRLASNCDPPDLCLLSSWDYRSEPPMPGWAGFDVEFIFEFFLTLNSCDVSVSPDLCSNLSQNLIFRWLLTCLLWCSNQGIRWEFCLMLLGLYFKYSHSRSSNIIQTYPLNHVI